MKIKTLTMIGILPFMVACSYSPLSVELSPAAQNIVVKNEKPIGNYELIAPVEAVNGKGCRDFGYLGNREDAIKTLKNKVSELHGDYAQITTVKKPHLDGGCYVNEYSVMALVYRKSNGENHYIPATTNYSHEEVFTKKMRELKSLLDDGVISSDEYTSQKAKLLEQGFNTK